MKKRPIITFILLLIIILAVSFSARDAYAYKIFDFTTVSDVVSSIKKRYGQIDCMSADFKLSSDKAGKKTLQQGLIKAKYPDKLLVEFSSPAGQRIVANDKTMWIYMPSLNVVAEQDLNSSDGSIFSGTRSGLTRLFGKYHYKFDDKEQPSTGPDGKKYFTLYLKQKESRSGYRTLRLWVSEDYLIRRVVGETSSGKKVEIEFTNIKTNENFPNGIFKFDTPSLARVIKNPMMAEE
jgi:outer membrane lipoprotein-sorting protein